MKNAVIYARYSSQGQNEQSIEGQIRICNEYAENNGYSVVKIYTDKARTGTNDSRPDFQRMIKDAASGKFEFVIVYMFDRFARNRRDSIMYKEMLKQEHGIRVISATQPISDDEGGEFYEMFLEWNDEKYSKRLSKRVRNGLDTSVENGTFCGGYLIFGYKLRQEPIAGKRNRFIKHVEIDEEQAEIVKYIFTEYDKGTDKKEIADTLNARGARYNGKPFKGRTFDKWLTNRKYTGEFYFGGRLCNNTYPAIIEKDLFERVQKRLAANRYFAGGTATARVPYLLTGKAFCAHCNAAMISDGGTSRTGQQHHYYICKGRKKGVCEKCREDKDELELFVTQIVFDFLSDENNAKVAVKDTLAYYERRTGIDNIKSVEGKIAKAQKDIEEMTTAFIEAKNALLRASIEKRMNDYEKLIEDLQSQKAQLERERGKQYSEKDLLKFIADLLKGDPADKDYQKQLIDNIVTKVFVGDGYVSAHLKIGNATEVEDIRYEEIKTAFEHIFGVQTLSPMAQRKGFEPLDTFLHHTISNRARSTAPPSLQNACLFYNKSPRNASHLHGFIKNIFAMRRFLINDPAAGEFSPAAGMLRNFVLTVLSLEKERDRSSAGVRADDAADLSDDDLARAETRLNKGNKVIDVLHAIAVADIDGIVFAQRLQLRHFIDKGGNGLLAPHRLADRNEMPLVVHVQNGLDFEQRADRRRRAADAPAALQVEQIVHREEMADMPFEFLGVVARLFDGRARIRLLHDVIDKKPLPERRAERIHHIHLAVGILFAKLLRRQTIALARAGKPRREGKHEHVFPRFEIGLHMVHYLRGRCLKGFGERAAAEKFIELFHLHRLAPVAAVRYAVQRKAQWYAIDAVLRIILIGEIASCVRHQNIVSFHSEYHPWIH